MTKRFILISSWSALFFLGSAILLYVAWRVYFALTGAPSQRPGEETFFWLGLSFAVVPLALGIFAVVIGIRGVLPGTRRVSA